MPIRIDEFNVTVPDGSIIGVVGGDAPFLRMSSGDPLDLLVRRQSGETLFVRDADPRICDEMWLIRDGAGKFELRRGDSAEVLAEYRAQEAVQFRAAAAGRQVVLPPSLRRGDGRAKLISLETLDAQENPTSAWTSGEEARVRVAVRFEAPVDDPVVGIMIRTRLGFEVYGTNTELERVKLGRVTAGDSRVVTFDFRCDLCAQEYTITAASHDPDGNTHDWLDDAIAFRVVDSRYTAGVANLRARVTVA